MTHLSCVKKNIVVNSKSLLKIYLLLIFSIQSGEVISQRIEVKGRVIDSRSISYIRHASVNLLSAKDSVLQFSQRTDINGGFKFIDIPSAEYILLITFPGYSDYAGILEIKPNNGLISIPDIQLYLKAKLLEEVIVNSTRAVLTIKGDTSEFNIRSLRPDSSASIEDIVRKLPGLSVGKNGAISINGQVVQRVLVDGEEFFSDDPTLITKNFKAYLIDKIQVYDKATEVGSGSAGSETKVKTMDVKLKKEIVSGYLGNVETGVGSSAFYKHNAMLTAFRGKRKLAAVGSLNNVGEVDINANISYELGDRRFKLLYNQLQDWKGTYNDEGIPRNISVGIQYINKFSNDQQSVNARYKKGRLNIQNASSSIVQNNLVDQFTIMKSNKKNEHDLLRDGYRLAYDLYLDSTSKLFFKSEGVLIELSNTEIDSFSTDLNRRELINKGYRQQQVRATSKGFYNSIAWDKVFNNGRAKFSTIVNTFFSNHDETGKYFFSNNPKNSVTSEVLDQQKEASTNNDLIQWKTSFSHPIGIAGKLTYKYVYDLFSSQSRLNTFNKGSGTRYDVLDSFYSGSYEYKTFTHTAGLLYGYDQKSFSIEAAPDVVFTTIKQQENLALAAAERPFVYPSLSTKIKFNFSRNRFITFSYTGNPIMPSMEQLRPITNNVDPLNIFKGNTGLSPFFSNRFVFNYLNYRTSFHRIVNFTASFTQNNKAIGIAVETDTVGRNIFSYINLPKANLFGDINLFFESKIKSLNLGVGIVGNARFGQFHSFANARLNTTTQFSYDCKFILSKSLDKKYAWALAITPSYTSIRSGLSSIQANNFWGFLSSISGDLTVLSGLELHSEVDYLWQQKTASFGSDFSRMVCDVSMKKRMLPQKNLIIKFSVNDIFNQKRGLLRYAQNNVVVQNEFLTLSRFFLASCVWEFNGTKK
jgi:hypothetical protein